MYVHAGAVPNTYNYCYWKMAMPVVSKGVGVLETTQETVVVQRIERACRSQTHLAWYLGTPWGQSRFFSQCFEP